MSSEAAVEGTAMVEEVPEVEEEDVSPADGTVTPPAGARSTGTGTAAMSPAAVVPRAISSLGRALDDMEYKDTVSEEIDKLRSEKKRLQSERQAASKLLKNAERARKRLKEKAKSLTTEDLIDVMHLRVAAAKAKGKRGEESSSSAAETTAPSDGAGDGAAEPSAAA